MREFTQQQLAAYERHQAEFSCKHVETSVRRRAIKGGSSQYVRQCLRCGDPVGNPIAKAKALAFAEHGGPAEFDVELQSQWRTLEQEARQKVHDQFGREAFHDHYAEYLASPTWKMKRALVLERAQNLCEGCRGNTATEVHHLTYAHVGNEFLFELVAVCDQCHKRLHEGQR